MSAQICEIIYIDKNTLTDSHISLEYRHVCLDLKFVLKLSTYELNSLVKKQNTYI